MRRSLLAGVVAGNFVSNTRIRAQPSDPATLTIDDARRLIAEKKLSPVELVRAYLARIEKLNPRINAYITVMTPTTMRMPPTIATAIADPTSEITLIRNTVPFNVLGIPTISIPCGFSRAGLPIGLQISGPRLGETRVLALAHAYEQATESDRRVPSL